MTLKPLGAEDLSLVAQLGQSEGWLIDIGEIERIWRRFPNFAIAAREGEIAGEIDDEFCGAIMGYSHEKTAWLCNLIVKSDRRGCGVGTALFKEAFARISAARKTQKLFAEQNAARIYGRFDFEAEGEADRFILAARTVKARSRKISRSIDAAQPASGDRDLFCRLSQEAFGEPRTNFHNQDMIHDNSLVFASQNAALHARTIGETVFVGSFLARKNCELEAENLLAKLVDRRGDRDIAIDAPAENRAAIGLLTRLGFKRIGSTILMSRGEKIKVCADMIYGFSTAGSHG